MLVAAGGAGGAWRFGFSGAADNAATACGFFGSGVTAGSAAAEACSYAVAGSIGCADVTVS